MLSSFLEVGTCGRTLNSATGWLSPEHVDNNGNYENNLDCWWTVVASDGYIVQLYIVEMDIAESQNCKGDYLEVGNRYTIGDSTVLFLLSITYLICSRTSMTRTLFGL